MMLYTMFQKTATLFFVFVLRFDQVIDISSLPRFL